MPKIPGMLVGLGVTAKTFMRTVFPDGLLAPPAPSKGSHTIQYPHVKEAPPDRARGVIALHHDNCTACMLCARECPDWCIYIEGHKELAPPRRAGGKPRQKNKLDRFDIDFALCMYCGICVEVCPFDALFWSPEFEFSELKIADLLHDKERLADWMETVPEFGAYESGSEAKVKKLPGTFLMTATLASMTPVLGAVVAQNIFFYGIAAVMVVAALRVVTTDNMVHAALYLVVVLAGVAALFILLGAEFLGVTQVLVYIGAVIVLFLFGIMLTRARVGSEDGLNHDNLAPAILTAALLLLVMGYAVIDFAKFPWSNNALEIDVLNRSQTTVEQVSDSIFSTYIVAFEAISVLLLAALIGAIVVARKE